MDPEIYRRTADIGADYLRSLPERPVHAEASLDELRAALGVPLDDAPLPALQVVEQLAAAVDPGLVGTQSPRYFGFVIGGSLDAVIAADWLTSVWDQNGGGYPAGPSASVVEEVACEWLLDLLGLRRWARSTPAPSTPCRRSRGSRASTAPGVTSTAPSASGPPRAPRCAGSSTAWWTPTPGPPTRTSCSTCPTTAAWRSSATGPLTPRR
jgi:hypothetical protein